MRPLELSHPTPKRISPVPLQSSQIPMSTTSPLTPSPTFSSSSGHHRATLQRLDRISSLSSFHQLHSQLIRLGLHSHPTALRKLLTYLSHHHQHHQNPTHHFSYLHRLLSHHHTPPHPSHFNSLFSALPFPYSAHLFSLMLSLSVHPDHFTFPPLLHSSPLHFTLQLHALLLKLNFLLHSHTFNSLLFAYLSSDHPAAARRLFRACSCLGDVVSWTTMVGGLAKLGLVDDARELFDEMPDRNLVSWNAMISAYVRSGRFADALSLFGAMREQGVGINGFVAASVLVACTGAGALERGREVHRLVEASGVEMDEKLATAVIDMYCKCGCVDEARQVFEGLTVKGRTSWNCMIGGFAVHGRGGDAIVVLKRMESEGLAPDDVTLVNVLSACAHSGMVREGKHYFDYVVRTYSIEPKMEHFGCMVDLLGRAGLLDEAKKVIDEMPMEPDAGVLGALLGACKIHGNVDLGEAIGWGVIELDPQNSGRYVLLANLFASAGRWEDVAKVRRLMDERKVNKEAGRSAIEIDGMVCEFNCGSLNHPHAREIYAMVGEMLAKIRLEGYVPHTGGVLHDIAEEEKESPLYHHSEKLAIAFGLLHTKPGKMMRITKNLRVCKDCHEASKLISRVFDREIIVRDRNRFHHFKGGACSCKDYW